MTKKADFPHFTPKFSVGTLVFCTGPFHCADGAFEDPNNDICYKKAMPMVITKIIAEVDNDGMRYQYKLRGTKISKSPTEYEAVWDEDDLYSTAREALLDQYESAHEKLTRRLALCEKFKAEIDQLPAIPETIDETPLNETLDYVDAEKAARFVTDTDVNGFTVCLKNYAVKCKRNCCPLVLTNAAVIMCLEICKAVVFVKYSLRERRLFLWCVLKNNEV